MSDTPTALEALRALVEALPDPDTFETTICKRCRDAWEHLTLGTLALPLASAREVLARPEPEVVGWRCGSCVWFHWGLHTQAEVQMFHHRYVRLALKAGSNVCVEGSRVRPLRYADE